MKALPGVKVVSVPSMSWSEGRQAQMSVRDSVTIGTSTNLHLGEVGFWLDAWIASGSARSSELTCFLTVNERVFRRGNSPDVEAVSEIFLRTNAAFGARVKVPERGAVFLISSQTNQNGKLVGAILTPSVLRVGK